ncbi:hypothetical protein EDB83DRAFT_2319897 [Lactarius deliciosus]|nr:hypothetical protein EDB83DRAFT_2319897 [Lactarius deliciosus]
MYLLKCTWRIDGTIMGDVVPLAQLRTLINSQPHTTAQMFVHYSSLSMVPHKLYVTHDAMMMIARGQDHLSATHHYSAFTVYFSNFPHFIFTHALPQKNILQWGIQHPPVEAERRRGSYTHALQLNEASTPRGGGGQYHGESGNVKSGGHLTVDFCKLGSKHISTQHIYPTDAVYGGKGEHKGKGGIARWLARVQQPPHHAKPHIDVRWAGGHDTPALRYCRKAMTLTRSGDTMTSMQCGEDTTPTALWHCHEATTLMRPASIATSLWH